MEPCTFLAQARRIKEVHSEKISYTSGKEAPKKFFVFSKKKAFLIFLETETPKRKL